MRGAALAAVLALAAPAVPANAGSGAAGDGAVEGPTRSPTDPILAELCDAVAERFYDRRLRGVDWEAACERYAPRVAAAGSEAQRAMLLNELLATLGTSHTRYLTPAEPAYFQLLGVFLPRNEALSAELARKRPGTDTRYVGIGVFTERDTAGRVFVRDVVHGLPAADAGLRVGDEILAVAGEPFRPIASFAGQAGEAVPVTIRRRAHAPPRALTVTPRVLDGATMFREALEASIRVVDHGGRRIGYARPWSYAGARYQQILETALFWGPLREAEALVLDLRGGWGGASPSYLNVFRREAISYESIARDGTRSVFPSAWTKPVVLLVDGRSRSGKELLAYGFRALGIGPIVGERTAGAVVAGMPVLLGDGSLLYVAVADVRVDGQRLEGAGVAPDLEVPFAFPYAAGADPQREAALDEAVRRLERARQAAGRDPSRPAAAPGE